ncbi:hypothetical protein MMC07_000195 [Pseudocyphellaria aurata]|nr:hypothetical protein [Pseudocyphellaria aurata]
MAEPSSMDSHQEDLMDVDLSVLVRPLPVDQSGIYSQALQLLSSMQASPSCSRLAASTLLNSCQNIEEPAPSIEATLDDVRSIYAAQLAMCEISSAGLAVPQECKSLHPVNKPSGLQDSQNLSSEENVRSRIARNIGKRQLSRCLRSLESRPQWWTSYSNSRQNAMVMCQAARVDIEKGAIKVRCSRFVLEDELIKLHKSMTETSSDVDSALSNTLRAVNHGLSEQRKFAVALEEFQKRLLQDLNASNLQAQSYLAKLVNIMDTATQSIMAKMTSAVQAVESDMTGLRENVHESNAEALDLQKNIQRVIQQILQGGSELAASQTKEWNLNRGLATELQNSLENIRSTEMHSLLDVIGSIHDQLRTSNELVSLMHFRQNALDERLFNIDKLYAGLETQAEAIEVAQTLQAKAQTQLHDQIGRMQVDMHVARGLLSEVTSSASSLQSTIEDASSKIAHISTFGSLTTMILKWGWVPLAVFTMYLFSPRFASYANAALVFLFLTNICGIPSLFQRIPSDTVLIHYASGSRIPLIPLLKVISAILLLLAAVILFWMARRRSSGLGDQIVGLTSSLDGLRMDFKRPKSHRTWNV